ncbi:unnamed protein product [Dibothriocephalus latus]|uniref:DUF5733 domain-containing protein n=1 Tax=Dibothriocephalus latus TaxID=60516 RepID=A0A3P7LEP9_DIBLA|nr:unnamed protein product [Dibothriocephalus latus]
MRTFSTDEKKLAAVILGTQKKLLDGLNHCKFTENTAQNTKRKLIATQRLLPVEDLDHLASSILDGSHDSTPLTVIVYSDRLAFRPRHQDAQFPDIFYNDIIQFELVPNIADTYFLLSGRKSSYSNKDTEYDYGSESECTAQQRPYPHMAKLGRQKSRKHRYANGNTKAAVVTNDGVHNPGEPSAIINQGSKQER